MSAAENLIPPEAWEEPDVVWMREGCWLVRKPFTYHDPVAGFDLLIPAGFRCDMASIPRLLWRVIAPQDLGERAALIHDWIYRKGGAVACTRGQVSPWFWYARDEADRLFLRVMEADGVTPWKRSAAYHAVRLFGRSAWQG